MSRKVKVEITLELACPIRQIGKMNLRHHIADAVETWGGQLPPDDLLFDAIERVETGKVQEL